MGDPSEHITNIQRKADQYQGFAKYNELIHRYDRNYANSSNIGSNGLPEQTIGRTQSLSSGAGLAALAALRLHQQQNRQQPLPQKSVPRTYSLQSNSGLRQVVYNPKPSYTTGNPVVRSASLRSNPRRYNSLTSQSSRNHTQQVRQQAYNRQSHDVELHRPQHPSNLHDFEEEEDMVITTKTTKVVDSQGRTLSITTKTIKTLPDGSNIIETTTKNISRGNSRTNSLSSGANGRLNSISSAHINLDKIDEDLHDFDYNYELDGPMNLNDGPSTLAAAAAAAYHPAPTHSRQRSVGSHASLERRPQPSLKRSEKPQLEQLDLEFTEEESDTTSSQPLRLILKMASPVEDDFADAEEGLEGEYPTNEVKPSAPKNEPLSPVSNVPANVPASPASQVRPAQYVAPTPSQTISTRSQANNGSPSTLKSPQKSPIQRDLQEPPKITVPVSVENSPRSPTRHAYRLRHDEPTSIHSPESSIKFDDRVETIPPAKYESAESKPAPVDNSADIYAAAMAAAYKKVYGVDKVDENALPPTNRKKFLRNSEPKPLANFDKQGGVDLNAHYGAHHKEFAIHSLRGDTGLTPLHKDRSKQERKAQKEAEKAQKEQEKLDQKEAERAQKEAEKAQKEAEKAQKDQEKINQKEAELREKEEKKHKKKRTFSMFRKKKDTPSPSLGDSQAAYPIESKSSGRSWGTFDVNSRSPEKSFGRTSTAQSRDTLDPKRESLGPAFAANDAGTSLGPAFDVSRATGDVDRAAVPTTEVIPEVNEEASSVYLELEPAGLRASLGKTGRENVKREAGQDKRLESDSSNDLDRSGGLYDMKRYDSSSSWQKPESISRRPIEEVESGSNYSGGNGQREANYNGGTGYQTGEPVYHTGGVGYQSGEPAYNADGAGSQSGEPVYHGSDVGYPADATNVDNAKDVDHSVVKNVDEVRPNGEEYDHSDYGDDDDEIADSVIDQYRATEAPINNVASEEIPTNKLADEGYEPYSTTHGDISEPVTHGEISEPVTHGEISEPVTHGVSESGPYGEVSEPVTHGVSDSYGEVPETVPYGKVSEPVTYGEVSEPIGDATHGERGERTGDVPLTPVPSLDVHTPLPAVQTSGQSDLYNGAKEDTSKLTPNRDTIPDELTGTHEEISTPTLSTRRSGQGTASTEHTDYNVRTDQTGAEALHTKDATPVVADERDAKRTNSRVSTDKNTKASRFKHKMLRLFVNNYDATR